MGVGEVLELIDGLPDALAEPIAYCRGAVDGAGDGGDGDFCQCGNGADIRGFGGGAAFCFSILVPANLERFRGVMRVDKLACPKRSPIDAGVLVRLECESNVTALRDVVGSAAECLLWKFLTPRSSYWS